MTDYRKISYTIIIGLFLSLTIGQAYAYEFKHFKLKSKASEEVEQRNLQAQSFGKNIAEDVKPEIIERINNLIGNDYHQIGSDQATPLVLNHDIGGGVLNFSGFTWNKPSGNINISANREVTPDMFTSQYIVHDTLTINVNANTYLTELRDADIIEISDTDLAAFVGIGFKRIYHYYHYAKDYKSGITSDYSKLFMAFNSFSVAGTINMDPYQILKKEDKFYFNAGGYVSTPPVNGVSLSAGVLVDIAFENKLTLQSIGSKDNKKEGEFLRVSQEKKWNVSATAGLSLQLDFFNILKLYLLEGELKYTYSKSHKQNLSFYENDIDLIMNSSSHHNEYRQIIKGNTEEVTHWKDNIVQLETRINENLSSRYSVLLFGSIRKKETEQVKVVKDGEESIFYKHYSQSTKYIQNLLSRLVNIVIVRLFDFNLGVRNFAESSKKMKVEYKYLSDLDKEIVKKEEQFSLTLTQMYSAGKTHRWIDRKLKKNAVRKIIRWSSLDRKIASLVQEETLRGPLSFESKIEIETAGLTYFHALSEDSVFASIVKVCKSRRLKSWLNDKKRKKMLRRLQIGRGACVKKLGNRYLDYTKHYSLHKNRDLRKFRRFIGKYFSKARNITHIQNIFGEENTFIHGSLFAKKKDGSQFSTYFNSGQFMGLGVIDNFIREDGTTTPVK